MSARETRATEALRRAGVDHLVHAYEAAGVATGRGTRPNYGLEAAAALGVDPARVFKTLIAAVDGRLVTAIVPVSAELDLKLLAGALGGRRATMAEPAEAERASGYVIGGISPIGQRRTLPAALDASAATHRTILVSAGRRGLQLELAPADVATLTGAIVARIARSD